MLLFLFISWYKKPIDKRTFLFKCFNIFIIFTISGQASFAVSRFISWASAGVEPGTLRFRVDVITHYTTVPQLVAYISPEYISNILLTFWFLDRYKLKIELEKKVENFKNYIRYHINMMIGRFNTVENQFRIETRIPRCIPISCHTQFHCWTSLQIWKSVKNVTFESTPYTYSYRKASSVTVLQNKVYSKV